MVKGGGMDAGIDVTPGQQRGEARRESKSVTRFGIIQRLYSQPISGQDNATGIALPEREREHAQKAFDAFCAPRMVRFDNDLGVPIGEKSIAAGLELFAKLSEIINAAVEGDPDSQFGVEHRLLRGWGEIEN